MNTSHIKSGKLFRGISAAEKVKLGLNASQIGRIFKRLAANSFIDRDIIKNISGHSMRVGAAQDLMKSGESFPSIMSRGRWTKTDTVMRYLELTSYQNN
jgi:hypothetical protein